MPSEDIVNTFVQFPCCNSDCARYQRVHHKPQQPYRKVKYSMLGLAPSEWVEICRVRRALQRGHGPRDAVTDLVGLLANRPAAAHADSCPFSSASKKARSASQPAPSNRRLHVVPGPSRAGRVRSHGLTLPALSDLCLAPMLLPRSVCFSFLVRVPKKSAVAQVPSDNSSFCFCMRLVELQTSQLLSATEFA